MIKKQIKKIILATSIIIPQISFAAFTNVKSLLTQFGGLLSTSITIVFGLALVYFFWGTGQFILNAGDQKKREEGRQKILWGIIALFVMASIWGIVAFIGSTLGIDTRVDTTIVPFAN